MPLSQEQEDLEHHTRIKLMDADIKLKNEQTRWEPWKVMTAAVTAAAAVFGSLGVVLGAVIGYMLRGPH